MAEVHLMGTATDFQNRITLQCVDNAAICATIAKARKLVYENGASINGDMVKNHLGQKSMVPTTVRVSQDCLVVQYPTHISLIERLFRQTLRFRFQLFFALPCRFVT
jgi:hypothetical protein